MSDDITNVRAEVGATSTHFITWNVKGMNGPNKRSKIFSHLKKLKAEIIFLQETHLKVADQVRLRKNWVGQSFHSNFNTRARGTAILIHKKVVFTPSQTISDPQGRFVIVSGSLFNTPVVLASIYAPNWDDVSFINKLISLIPNLNSHKLILAGDFNTVMDPAIDRSNPKTLVRSKMSLALSEFADQIGSVDPWRFLYPHKKEFSYFSHVHHTYSRIDFFLIDKTLLPALKKVEYTAIVESDHAPVSLDLLFAQNLTQRSTWRLNTALLTDSHFCNLISKAIDDFMLFNKSDSISPSTLWETLKVVVRGEIISYTISRNKERKQREQDLISSIRSIDRQYSITPTPELYKERIALKTQYDLLSTERTERHHLWSKGHYYEHGEKAGRLLAYQLKCRSASRLIPQIRNTSQSLTTDPVEINNTFKEFYSELYTSTFPQDNSNMTTFLDSIDIPTIDVTAKDNLDKPIQLQEIVDAINKMQSGKSPGLDGYPVEFYKKFSSQLAPILLEMFNYSFNQNYLPQTLTEASISLLLKPGKDPLDCGSYRPISLLNSDVKILAKLLSSRLDSVVSQIISMEQSGFMRGRHSFTNIRKLLNVIHSPASGETPEVVVSLDAEKAFDRVEWCYLFAVLGKFGFGSNFISWIRLLYTAPKASVLTNKLSSHLFSLSRGTRQGCPLSPLLFALAIEPLSIKFRTAPDILGIQRLDTEHRVSLYADDLLLYISDPVSCVPNIINILNDFGRFSGYKLNLSKSECFPVNNLALHIPDNTLPFRMSRTGFKYLGIQITRVFSDLYVKNFKPLLLKLESDLKRWSVLYLSLVGRVNCIKMNVLPRFLYLFQCLPVFLSKSFFQSLNKLISSFLWAGKNPRIRRELLERPRDQGGLALPNMEKYYWASNIQKVTYWYQAPELDWCKIEANSCFSTSLSALITAKLPFSPSKFSSSPVVISTLKILAQFRRKFKLKEFSVYSPICDNHLFPASRMDHTFTLWRRNGLTLCYHFYIDGLFATFTDLSEKFHLQRSDLFRYFQVRHFIQSQSPSFPALPTDSGLEKILRTPIQHRRLISNISNIITSLHDTSLERLRTEWAEELGMEISDAVWDRAQARVNGTSSCACLSLIQFKVFHRIYYTKSKLARIYSDIQDRCERCNSTPADMSHMFWTCAKLRDFWSSVCNTLNDAFGTNVKPSADMAIFGVLINEILLPTDKKNVFSFASLLARRRIALQWKSPDPPKGSVWLSDLMFFLKLEKIKYFTRGSTRKFHKIWDPLILYFDKLNTLP